MSVTHSCQVTPAAGASRPAPVSADISSAIASSNSCLFLTCQYSVGACTPSSLASTRMLRPSRPTSLSRPSAVRAIRSEVSFTLDTLPPLEISLTMLENGRGGMTMERVVIAGGGPTGLMLACELRLAGVDVLVLERLAGPSGESRAGGIHARTMEILDMRGIIEPFLAEGRRIPGAHFAGIPLSLSGLEEQYRTKYPFLLNILQRRIERLLEAGAPDLGVRGAARDRRDRREPDRRARRHPNHPR